MAVAKLFDLTKISTRRYLLSRILLVLGAFVSLLWSCYFAVATILIPYQIELREGAAQVLTGFVMNGNNPFTFENQPLGMNNYGLAYNLVVAPFAAKFGNTLLVHRSVTFGFIILSALASFWLIYRSRKDAASALSCAAFIAIGLIARTGIGAFPSSMGTFLFLLTILIPYLKRFTPTSLLLSILFSLMAFYTKPYFVLGMVIVASYLFLFVSKRTGLLYGILFLMLFAISFAVMRLVFPLYFINTVIGNISNSGRSIVHLLSQLKELLFYFFPLLGSSILLLVQDSTSKRTTGQTFNVQNWIRPLLGNPVDYFFCAFLCSFLAYVLVLGLHVGSYLNYAYQLIVPVFSCWFFLKFDPEKKMGLLISLLVVLNLFLWQWYAANRQLLEQQNSKEWAELYSYVSRSSNILNSALITSGTIEYGLNPLDSGQTMYYYMVKPYPNNAILGPSYEDFYVDGSRYIKFIDDSIETQKFDLIITTVEESSFYHSKLLDMFYMPVTEIKVEMPQSEQQWTVLVWQPQAK